MSIRITVKLFKNGDMVESIVLPTKTRVLNYIQGKNGLKWDFGECRVTYNYKEKLYNDFSFENIESVKQHLSTDCCLSPVVIAHCS